MNNALHFDSLPFNLKRLKSKVFNYPKFQAGSHLTQDQIDFFEEHGFIHFKNFIDKETVASIIQSSLEVQDQWIAQKVQIINGVPIKYGRDIDGKQIVQRFAFLSHYSSVLHNLLKDPRLEALLPLLGKEGRIAVDEKDGAVLNHYINTETSNFTKLGWHTDCLRDVFYGKKIEPMLNVGIHLSDMHPENGGLRIIPGTHKQSIFSLLFRKIYFLDNRPDKNEIAIRPQAGDLTVHDGRLWHRAAKSDIIGEESRRRVIYIPFISGAYNPKDSNSKTLLYQRFSNFVK